MKNGNISVNIIYRDTGIPYNYVINVDHQLIKSNQLSRYKCRLLSTNLQKKKIYKCLMLFQK